MSGDNGKRRMLAVNPYPEVNEVFPVLQKEGWSVEVADSVPEGGMYLERRRYDVLLLRECDIQGEGSIRPIRRSFPGLKIIGTGKTATEPDWWDAYVTVPDELNCLHDMLNSVTSDPPQTDPVENHVTPPPRPSRSAGSFLRTPSRWKRAVLRPQQLYSAVVDSFHTISGASWVSLLLRDSEAETGLTRVSSRGRGVTSIDIDSGRRNSAGRNIRFRSVPSGPPFPVPDVDDLADGKVRVFHSNRYLCVPLKSETELVGALNLGERCEGAVYEEGEIKLFSALAEEAATLIQLSRQVENLREEARVDALTGIYNRRHFRTELRREVDRARRVGRSLMLAILDLDHFKVYNDQNGHPAGDRALQEVAQVIQANIRRSDILCRYGGEEFAIILPDSGSEVRLDREVGVQVLERVREAVARHEFEEEHVLPGGCLTISGGVVAFREDADSAEEMVQSADSMLYRAKQTGRNRVLAAS